MRLFWQLQVWAAPLAGGARAVLLFNRHVASDEKFDEHNMTLHWSMVGYPTDLEVILTYSMILQTQYLFTFYLHSTVFASPEAEDLGTFP